MNNLVILGSVSALDLMLVLEYVHVRVIGASERDYWLHAGHLGTFILATLLVVAGVMGIRRARRPERKRALQIALLVGLVTLVGAVVGLGLITSLAGRPTPAAFGLLLLGAGHVAIASLLAASLVEPDERTGLGTLLEEMLRRRG